MPLTASEMWRAKCMKIAGKLINWSRLSNTLNIICEVVFPVCAFQEDLFYQRQSGQNFILLLLLPPRDSLSALESLGIPGCMCREPGMPCVCTRLMALGKEAIFIPKHAVVQVKSAEITIAAVFRSLALSFPLQRFSCTSLLTWASSAPLGHRAQGVCCRDGWRFSLCHISQAPSFTRASFWHPAGQRWKAAVQHREGRQELSVSLSLRTIPVLALDSFQRAWPQCCFCPGMWSSLWGLGEGKQIRAVNRLWAACDLEMPALPLSGPD